MSKWDKDVLFKCPCGREKYVKMKNLKNTHSCGCKQKESIVGRTFGFLKVLSLATEADRFKYGVICECACGNTVCYRQGSVSTGNKKSCGCSYTSSRMNVLEPSFDPYDLSQPSPTADSRYNTYMGARYRCKEGGHKDYGGRGIKFLWKDFKDFCDDMGERPEGYTLERVDVNGDYCKGNCIWADMETQANNKRTSRFVTVGELTMTIAQWERHTGLYEGQVKERVKRYGWSLEDACSVPSKAREPTKLITVDGETKTTIEWEDLLGLRRGLINSRIHAGWDKETACKTPTRESKVVVALGMSKTIREWEIHHGLKEDTISARIRTGRWSDEDACSKGKCY